MRFLLDTHVWLWMQTAPERLPAKARAALASTANEVFLSVASVWEMAIKSQRGRLPLPEPLEAYVRRRCADTATGLLPISPTAVFELARLPPIHADPFDRMLVAQARTESLRLVTADSAVARYEVELLRV